MSAFLADFHFLRPPWLIAVLPLFLLWWLIWRAKANRTAWHSIIPDYLLTHLLEGRAQQAARWQLYGVAAAWFIACVALAGPTWQKLPLPVHRSESAVIAVLDLSPSMHAEDIKPSRLVRARYKLTDYLNQRTEGTAALIAYAGEAHVVSPLTDDTETINNLLPALEPAIMPLTGSNIEMAIETALQLLKDASIAQGDILLLTDGIAPDAFAKVSSLLSKTTHRLSIIGVGTNNGAPIPTGNGGFTKDRNGNIVVAKLNSDALRSLALETGGTYSPLQPDSRDIQQITEFMASHDLSAQQQQVLEREFDTWRDQGHWLAILLLPFAALAFRRGWLLSVCCAALLFPEQSHAFEWRDLWLTPDQQGQRSFAEGELEQAAREFANPAWQGSAHYKNGDYAAAAEAFAQGESATDHYNLGNALLQQRKIDEAINAYEESLALDPSLEDAKANLAVAKALRDQEKQKQASDESQDGEQSEKQDGDPQDGDQGKQQAQNQQSDQQDSEQDGQQQNADQSQPSDEDSASSDSQTAQQENESAAEESAQQLAEEEGTREDLSDAQREALEQLAEQELSEKQLAQQLKQQETEQGSEQNTDAVAQMSLQELAENAEKQQALEQWLRQIPDDPGGLLRRKFEYQHRQLRQQYRTGEWHLPDNEAYERW